MGDCLFERFMRLIQIASSFPLVYSIEVIYYGRGEDLSELEGDLLPGGGALT